MPIAPVAPSPPPPPAAPGASAAPGGGATSFAGVLGQALAGLDGLQAAADTASQQLASGQASDIATAVVAAEKANLGLSLAVQIRNQALSAYQQLMQLQI